MKINKSAEVRGNAQKGNPILLNLLNLKSF